MMLTNTALTPAALLSLLADASATFEVPERDGIAIEQRITVVDFDVLRDNINAMIAQQPANLFADLIGMNVEQAQAYINTRCNGDEKITSYNNAGTKLPLVSSTTILFEDGRETQALYDRTNALRGTSGMITGKGLGIEYDLMIAMEDGKISEIIHYGE